MTNPGVFQLFVYGSLRSGFHSPVYEYISRFFIFIGEAKVQGKLFDMGSYPAGVPTTDDSFIIGELYQAKNEHEFSWANIIAIGLFNPLISEYWEQIDSLGQKKEEKQRKIELFKLFTEKVQELR